MARGAFAGARPVNNMLSVGGLLANQKLTIAAMMVFSVLEVNAHAEQISCGPSAYCFEDVTPGGVEGFPKLGGSVAVMVIHAKEKKIETLVKLALICELTKMQSGNLYRLCIKTDEQTRKSIERNKAQHATFSLALRGAGPTPSDNNAINPTADVETSVEVR